MNSLLGLYVMLYTHYVKVNALAQGSILRKTFCRDCLLFIFVLDLSSYETLDI